MEEKLQNHINEEVQKTLDNHSKHLEVANFEMGIIKQDVGILKNDVGWIKEKLSDVSNKVWWILGSIIFGILIQILFKIFGK